MLCLVFDTAMVGRRGFAAPRNRHIVDFRPWLRRRCSIAGKVMLLIRFFFLFVLVAGRLAGGDGGMILSQ